MGDLPRDIRFPPDGLINDVCGPTTSIIDPNWGPNIDLSQARFLRIGNRVFALKGPRYPALFSERNRRNIRVLPLFGGWRITIRKVA